MKMINVWIFPGLFLPLTFGIGTSHMAMSLQSADLYLWCGGWI